MATALVAAYLLVLQALLAGMSAGAHAGAALSVDPFGQVICRGATSGTETPSDPAHHTPDCCTTGCQTSAAAGAPPPVALAFEVPLAPFARALPVLRADVGRSSLDHAPRNARAPPLA